MYFKLFNNYYNSMLKFWINYLLKVRYKGIYKININKYIYFF